MSDTDTAVIVAAAGRGERFGRSGGKQLAEIGGRPLLAHTLEACASAERIGLVVTVVEPERLEEYADALADSAVDTEVRFVPGGERRQESIAAGLAEVPEDVPFIAVHDGARPLVTTEDFLRALRLLEAEPELAGVVVGHPAVDTLKIVEEGRVLDTPDRSRYWVAQTPQVFRGPDLRAAYASAKLAARDGTDDSSLVEAAGGAVRMIEGSRENIKVTVAEDLAFVQTVIESRGGR